MMDEQQYQRLLDLLRVEICHATKEHGSFSSAHEGYAVLLEELDELWAEVMKKRDLRSKPKMRYEAIQVAAMAIRFAMDICPVEEEE